jgi:hypothetical protein
MTPAQRARGGKAVAEARALTDSFNAAVERALAGIRRAAPHGIRTYRLDVREMAVRVRREPATFGFKDVTTPCKGLPTCEGYLFWDEVHPTTQAHGELAEAAFRTCRLNRNDSSCPPERLMGRFGVGPRRLTPPTVVGYWSDSPSFGPRCSSTSAGRLGGSPRNLP